MLRNFFDIQEEFPSKKSMVFDQRFLSGCPQSPGAVDGDRTSFERITVVDGEMLVTPEHERSVRPVTSL